jgi:hypothetical protein
MFQVNDMRGDMVLSATLRSDLAPIPLTFEGRIRVTQQTAADFKDDAVITVNQIPFRIVKCVPILNAGGGPQGREPLSAVEVTAYPDGLQALGKPRTAAAIFQNASLAGIYRACGATVPVSGDLTLSRFACLIGSIPTFHLARALQEEAACVMWRKGGLKVMALRDVLAQVPIDVIDTANSEGIKSETLKAEQIPVFYSIGPDGKFISAPRTDAAQAVAYTPRKTARALNFMGRVLVRRKTVTGKVNPSIKGGDVVSVGGVPMVVMTAVQHAENGGDGGGPEQYTRLFLGTLS